MCFMLAPCLQQLFKLNAIRQPAFSPNPVPELALGKRTKDKVNNSCKVMKAFVQHVKLLWREIPVMIKANKHIWVQVESGHCLVGFSASLQIRYQTAGFLFHSLMGEGSAYKLTQIIDRLPFLVALGFMVSCFF